MLHTGLFQFIESFNAGFPKFDTKLYCTSLLEIALFHFRDTHTQNGCTKNLTKKRGDANELKLVLEVYETFTYPSLEGEPAVLSDRAIRRQSQYYIYRSRIESRRITYAACSR
jgi:hypothetical protein